MNNKVTVTGMQVNTRVSSNLFVSPDTSEAHFTTQLAKSVSALVEPVSTIDGKSFFYTASNNVVAGAKTKAAPAQQINDMTYYCLITGADGNIYRTAVITVIGSGS